MLFAHIGQCIRNLLLAEYLNARGDDDIARQLSYGHEDNEWDDMCPQNAGDVVLIPVQIWTSGGIGRSHADHMAGLEPNPYDLFLHELHTFTGLAILGLVVLRLLLRLVSGSSRAAGDGGRFLRLLALANHFALYAALVMLPATGLLARYFDFATFGSVHVGFTRLLRKRCPGSTFRVGA